MIDKGIIMRVDVRKLDDVRELLDACITEKCLRWHQDRGYALETLIWELGYGIEIWELDHWYFASAILHDDQQRTNRIYLRKGLAAAVVFESHQFSKRSVVAPTREDALMALACVLIDPAVDIFLAEPAVLPSVFWSRCDDRSSESRFWREISESQWQEFDEVCGPTELRTLHSGTGE